MTESIESRLVRDELKNISPRRRRVRGEEKMEFKFDLILIQAELQLT
jgi:hypothetical protein